MRRRGAAAISAAIMVLAASAPAQTPGLGNERTALATARQAAADAEARAVQLDQAARQAGNAADRARAEATALGLRVKAAEADLAAAKARIALIASLQSIERSRIAARQGPLLHLLAALQTMTRRPPALALAQPGSLADLVHVRLLLADTMPVIQARTAELRADLGRQTQLRTDAEQAANALAASRALLARRQQAFAAIEATAIRRSQRLAERAAEEQQRALGLGEDARDIADRMQALAEAGDVQARLERLPDPAPRPSAPGDALPVQEGRPRYRLPMAGAVSVGFGEVSPAGVRARGLTLVTAPGARVVAPAAGTVLFAGPFRSYGRIVILAHGGGWTTTITGLDSSSVKAGDLLAQGETIGRAGQGHPLVSAELRRDNRPIDILAMAQSG